LLSVFHCENVITEAENLRRQRRKENRARHARSARLSSVAGLPSCLSERVARKQSASMRTEGLDLARSDHRRGALASNIMRGRHNDNRIQGECACLPREILRRDLSCDATFDESAATLTLRSCRSTLFFPAPVLPSSSSHLTGSQEFKKPKCQCTSGCDGQDSRPHSRLCGGMRQHRTHLQVPHRKSADALVLDDTSRDGQSRVATAGALQRLKSRLRRAFNSFPIKILKKDRRIRTLTTSAGFVNTDAHVAARVAQTALSVGAKLAFSIGPSLTGPPEEPA